MARKSIADRDKVTVVPDPTPIAKEFSLKFSDFVFKSSRTK